MRVLKHLFENNRSWAEGIRAQDPDFFQKLSRQQSPDYLWIGCSDSRVPANQVIGLLPGEVFVHRNVANVVAHSDLNCLSVLQFAVDALKVRHVIVCGHYNCGGVRAVLQGDQLGFVDEWLHHVRDVNDKHAGRLAEIEDPALRCNKLCEWNVVEQVRNVCQTSIVANAWRCGRELAVHGWIYDLNDGLLRDLNVCSTNPREAVEAYRSAIR